MKNIPEIFLQFLWKYRLFNQNALYTDEGKVEVIETGEHNTGSGPDFFNARIRINDTTWAGNVEIHTKASDWFRHGHSEDPAYSNVILHVVQEKDCLLERPGGEIIPTVVLEFDMSLYEKYSGLIKNRDKIPCGQFLGGIPSVYWTDWISKIMIKRLEEKTLDVKLALEDNKYNWEETLYRFIGKGFGLKINTYPFEALVRSTPLMALLKYRERPLTINAVLFGQSGFLEDLISEDDYYIALQKEYRSIHSTLPARTLGKHVWKFKGSRPANFPTVRISQFASLITGNYPIFSFLLENLNLSSWRRVLELGTDRYWDDHYLFGKTGRTRKIRMGSDAINSIILNAFIPVYFYYAIFRKRNDLKDKLISILEELPAEKNAILNKWNTYGIAAKSAFESQSLNHLTTRYCEKRRCLECMIGKRVIGGG